jgi:hypothetical protein
VIPEAHSSGFRVIFANALVDATDELSAPDDRSEL